MLRREKSAAKHNKKLNSPSLDLGLDVAEENQ
jgi:hypothetical protein